MVQGVPQGTTPHTSYSWQLAMGLQKELVPPSWEGVLEGYGIGLLGGEILKVDSHLSCLFGLHPTIINALPPFLLPSIKEPWTLIKHIDTRLYFHFKYTIFSLFPHFFLNSNHSIILYTLVSFPPPHQLVSFKVHTLHSYWSFSNYYHLQKTQNMLKCPLAPGGNIAFGFHVHG